MWWYNIPANKLNCFVLILIWTLCGRSALFTLVSVELRPRHFFIIITANWYEGWYDGFLCLKCWLCMMVITAGTRFFLSAHQFLHRHCTAVLKVKMHRGCLHSIPWYGMEFLQSPEENFQLLQWFRTSVCLKLETHYALFLAMEKNYQTKWEIKHLETTFIMSIPFRYWVIFMLAVTSS